MSLNRAIIIGRIGQDPKMASTQSGQSVANFSMATDESYKDSNGNKIEKAEWHRIVVWGKQAEFANNYLRKGRLVLVEGKIQTRKWQNKEGQDQYTTEIVAQRVSPLDKKPDNQHPLQPAGQPTAQAPDAWQSAFPEAQPFYSEEAPPF
jgi:single-strand DNA-binding protein